jgi:hypothetical protein
MSTSRNFLTGGDTRLLQFDCRNNVTGSGSRIRVSPALAFQITESVNVAVAAHNVGRPVNIPTVTHRSLGNLHAAFLVGDDVTSSGNKTD